MNGAGPAHDALLGVVDPRDARRVQRGPHPLRDFNAAGILAPADVHVATTLSRLVGEADPSVLLAVALAVRAPRFGHVFADLATARRSVTADEDVAVDADSLPWPDVDSWVEAVATSPLTALTSPLTAVTSPAITGGTPAGSTETDTPAEGERPLRLVGSHVYLDRYWRYQQRVVDALRRRSASGTHPVDVDVLRDGLDRLFRADRAADGGLRPRLAATVAVLRPLAVIAGGPGTGKTTTVASILALLEEQAAAAGRRPPRIALAAPTGKAADRLAEAVHERVVQLRTDDAIRARLTALGASTIHRLLGVRSDSRTRFRHDRTDPLPHDVVVIDETSMVSLSLMAKLLDAVRDDARLVLVGDPDQLTSVETGTVLGDVVGPTTAGLHLTEAARSALGRLTGQPVAAHPPPAGSTIGDSIVVLTTIHRFGRRSGIAELATAIQRGRVAAALELLDEGRPDVGWIPADPARDTFRGTLGPVRDAVSAAWAAVHAAARAGSAPDALDALGRLRILCAHRRGPAGVATWVARTERWLAQHVDGYDTDPAWYVGRPVMVTANDYQVGVFNGEQGVVVQQRDGRVAVAFEQGGDVRLLDPARLDAVETAHAMTVHKSQGSQFAHVIVVLTEPASPILTRQLLYTAVTRARERVTIVGRPEAVRAAIDRQVQRASGLRDALWGASTPGQP
ncbi:MAG: exodeoxyribonuclease V subunit alpha [Actinomycetota bacterium]|nr:exodeoxyribonuclease V subunit alpha [Actinomycetota bacterium]